MSYRKRPIMGTDVITNGQTGALLVEPTTTISNLLGDGSDDAWHLTSSATMAKALYQFTSLEIDEGVVLSAPQWWIDLIPVVEIRCQTPIVLNGSIAAGNVTGWNNWGTIAPTGRDSSYPRNGQGPALIAPSTDDVDFLGLYTIAGAGNSSYASRLGGGWLSPVLPGYSDSYLTSDPSSYITDDPVTFIGIDRPFRFAAGGGGSCDSGADGSGGGNGGGILLIRAPGIIFGPNASITARGGDASTDGTNHNAGGGGGGHVELWTQAALSPAEKARILVSGGAGDVNGFNGLDGVTIYEVF